jgi:hypothetical protein
MQMRFLVPILLLAGCSQAPSGLLDASPTRLDATYRRVLVVGVGEDEAARRVLEAAFASRLPSSYAASSVIPGAGQPDAAAIRSAEGRLGLDAVLVIRLLKVHQHSDSAAGFVHGLPASAMPVGFGQFYDASLLADPARWEAASLEVDLWSVGTDSLAWSALTPVFTPTDASVVTASAASATGAALAPAPRR